MNGGIENRVIDYEEIIGKYERILDYYTMKFKKILDYRIMKYYTKDIIPIQPKRYKRFKETKEKMATWKMPKTQRRRRVHKLVVKNRTERSIMIEEENFKTMTHTSVRKGPDIVSAHYRLTIKLKKE